MPTALELRRLLSLVEFDARLDYVEGVDAFRNLLRKDADGRVLRFLTRQLSSLDGKKRAGIAFAIAEHYLLAGDVEAVRRLYAIDDAEVKESVLNALWDEPGSNPQMGPAIVQLAVQAAKHASVGVRVEACFVFQNQCAWGVDVSDAIIPLHSLLSDRAVGVRSQAAYAVGNLAKRRYDMSAYLPQLRRNARHRIVYVKNASAWALWQLSRSKHDIGSAVPELVELASDDDEWEGPRQNAAGALLHHARKSTTNAMQVRNAVKSVPLDRSRKEIKRFLEQLARLN